MTRKLFFEHQLSYLDPPVPICYRLGLHSLTLSTLILTKYSTISQRFCTRIASLQQAVFGQTCSCTLRTGRCVNDIGASSSAQSARGLFTSLFSCRSNTCVWYSHIWWHHSWARRRSAVWTPCEASGPWCPPLLRLWLWVAPCSGKSPICCSSRGRQTGSDWGGRHQHGHMMPFNSLLVCTMLALLVMLGTVLEWLDIRGVFIAKLTLKESSTVWSSSAVSKSLFASCKQKKSLVNWKTKSAAAEENKQRWQKCSITWRLIWHVSTGKLYKWCCTNCQGACIVIAVLLLT